MQIFDAHVRAETRDDDDIRNLRYFETTHVLTASHPSSGFVRAEELVEYWRRLHDVELPRLRGFDITPYLALGIRPDGRPRRTHHEIWSALDELLESENVVAVGEVAALEDTDAHWKLFERQARLAMEHGLALLVTPPTELRVNMTYKMMRRLEKIGFPPERAMMNHLDTRLVETVAGEGFLAGVTVGPYHLEPRDAARFLAGYLEQSGGNGERVVLNSGLRSGAADILSIPKTIVALQDAGVSREVLHAMAFQNAYDALVGA